MSAAWAQLVGKAVVNGKLTKTQGASLVRHRRHHSSGHMLLMIRLMIERHMSFTDAHATALRQVGR